MKFFTMSRKISLGPEKSRLAMGLIVMDGYIIERVYPLDLSNERISAEE